MSNPETGQVTMQIDGHVCTITVDNQAKKNAYTPAMLDRLAELLTEYEDNDDLWVATFCSAGEHTTAGRKQVFASEDFKEGIQSFVERRKAKFAGR